MPVHFETEASNSLFRQPPEPDTLLLTLIPFGRLVWGACMYVCRAAIQSDTGLGLVQSVYKLGEYVSARQAAVVVDLQWIACGQSPRNFPNASKKVSLLRSFLHLSIGASGCRRGPKFLYFLYIWFREPNIRQAMLQISLSY